MISTDDEREHTKHQQTQQWLPHFFASKGHQEQFVPGLKGHQEQFVPGLKGHQEQFVPGLSRLIRMLLEPRP